MPNWEGYEERECGEHRTLGSRAWCFQDSEYCYPEIPCRGCELPLLRATINRVPDLDPRWPRLLAAARSWRSNLIPGTSTGQVGPTNSLLEAIADLDGEEPSAGTSSPSSSERPA